MSDPKSDPFLAYMFGLVKFSYCRFLLFTFSNALPLHHSKDNGSFLTESESNKIYRYHRVSLVL